MSAQLVSPEAAIPSRRVFAISEALNRILSFVSEDTNDREFLELSLVSTAWKKSVIHQFSTSRIIGAHVLLIDADMLVPPIIRVYQQLSKDKKRLCRPKRLTLRGWGPSETGNPDMFLKVLRACRDFSGTLREWIIGDSMMLLFQRLIPNIQVATLTTLEIAIDEWSGGNVVYEMIRFATNLRHLHISDHHFAERRLDALLPLQSLEKLSLGNTSGMPLEHSFQLFDPILRVIGHGITALNVSCMFCDDMCPALPLHCPNLTMLNLVESIYGLDGADVATNFVRALLRLQVLGLSMVPLAHVGGDASRVRAALEDVLEARQGTLRVYMTNVDHEKVDIKGVEDDELSWDGWNTNYLQASDRNYR
ncbi:hypothetical protein M427DRAFT_502459 [Gonapodya prolifera JEL478]|uniref:Uncharacterized protein n=1 Tax=Gonapodya prolifera (strain JEL478) TaxID=1344416 RepID=A0A139A6N7_GONPJ|nr:hypothetical protein M427DRAFT_502459 [Gonapodya prolifera JEL478]|eukprot:KXS12431.1 hypothetical protein M427DRAFT_502459 [Gonapodya prolifera JEL478]